jgi:hypothetical protein
MTAANAPVPPAIVAPPDRFSAGRVFFCALTSAAPQVAFAVPMPSSLRHTLSMAKQVDRADFVAVRAVDRGALNLVTADQARGLALVERCSLGSASHQNAN